MSEYTPSDEWEITHKNGIVEILYIPTDDRLEFDDVDTDLRPQIEALISGLEELLEEEL